MRLSVLIIAASLAACTAADVSEPTALEAPAMPEPWAFDLQADTLRALSCPEGVAFKRADAVDIDVIEAELGSRRARELQLTGFSLVGAWELKSNDPRFGGLSGLAVMRSGSLLTVSDDGAFVWIGVDPERGAPDGIGSIAEFRDRGGARLRSKRAGDAEGLALRDGLALVSFERDHRINAYDLETCGAAARAAPVVTFNRVIDRAVLKDNNGAEGLTLAGDTLLAGFEVHRRGGSPIGTVAADGALLNLTRTQQPLAYLLTGMDHHNGLTAYIFRAFDPARGARGLLRVTESGKVRAEATLKHPLPVDNFEGVAIAPGPNGETRIWLISDDNFNSVQRTLLLAFDLDD